MVKRRQKLAREKLRQPAATYTTSLAEHPPAICVATAVHNATLGLNNPYGQTLGGTRVIECPEKSARRTAAKLASELAADMTRKYLTLYRMVSDLHQLGLATDYEVRATQMGGGKSVIAVSDLDTYRQMSLVDRARLFLAHGQHIDRLQGKHITAVDMGTSPKDMDHVLENTPYVACQSVKKGGTGDPSPTTALGVWYAAKAAMEADGTFDPATSTYSIQGLGHVGRPLAEFILAEYPKARLVVTDAISQRATDLAAAHLDREIQIVYPEQIYSAEADVFMPCAGASILTLENLSKFPSQTKLICGAANDPYPTKNGEPDADLVQAYHKADFTVIPAPLANLGGILHVSMGHWKHWDGGEGEYNDSRAMGLVAGIAPLTRNLYLAAQEQYTPMEEAYQNLVAETYAAYCRQNRIAV